MLPCLRPLASVLVTVLLLPVPSSAMDTSLYEEAVREAYFLGQRHEEDLALLLAKYVKALPMPESGPNISSITLLTPFALVAQLSSQRSFSYSAQEAEQDHRKQEEIVRIIIQIQLTETYGALITRPLNPKTGSPFGLGQRPSDFWKDFQVQVLGKEKILSPSNSSGEPIYGADGNGGSILIGATLQFDFPAKAFKSDSPTVQVTPPEGDPVSVDFDLTRLR